MKSFIYSPLLSLMLFVASSSFMLTFISVRINVIDGSDIILGLIHSAFYGGMLIGALKSEEIINRVGHIRAFASFSSLLTVTIILQAMITKIDFWVILRFFAGFATAAIYVIIESWLLARSTKKNKGKVLSIYMLCLYSAQTISQFGLDIIDINGLGPYLLAALAASISVIPASLTYIQAPEIQSLPKMKITKYFWSSPLGFVGCIVSGLILSAIYGFMPGYAFDHNLSVSILMGVTISGGFILQWPIGKLSDTFDRVLVITILSVSIILLCLLLSFLPLMNWLIYIICFFLGGLCFTLYPVCIAQVCDYLDDPNIINITGVLLFAYGIGAVSSPPIVALLAKSSGAVALFYFIGATSLSLVMLGVYFLRHVENIKQEDSNELVSIPRVSPIGGTIAAEIENRK